MYDEGSCVKLAVSRHWTDTTRLSCLAILCYLHTKLWNLCLLIVLIYYWKISRLRCGAVISTSRARPQRVCSAWASPFWGQHVSSWGLGKQAVVGGRRLGPREQWEPGEVVRKMLSFNTSRHFFGRAKMPPYSVTHLSSVDLKLERPKVCLAPVVAALVCPRQRVSFLLFTERSGDTRLMPREGCRFNLEERYFSAISNRRIMLSFLDHQY